MCAIDYDIYTIHVYLREKKSFLIFVNGSIENAYAYIHGILLLNKLLKFVFLNLLAIDYA